MVAVVLWGEPREGWRQKVAIACLEAGLHRLRIGNGIAHVALDGSVLSCFLQADDRAAAPATFTGHRGPSSHTGDIEKRSVTVFRRPLASADSAGTWSPWPSGFRNGEGPGMVQQKPILL
jgi:hypothetical protein